MDIDWIFASRVIWVAFIVIWGVMRWRPNVRSRKFRVKSTHRSLREQIALVISFTGLGLLPGVWVATGFPRSLNFEPAPYALVVGVVLFVASLVLFRMTHKALGAMWSNSLDLREGHRLITTSIYTRLRHPMYTAFWLWAAAQSFTLGNWLVAFSGIVGFGTLFFMRIGAEERMMEQEFGQEYLDYVKKTKKIIPGIY